MKVLMVARWPVGGIRTFLRYVYSEPVFADCEITLLAPGKGLAEDLGGFLPAERFHVDVVKGGGRELCLAVRARLRREHFDLLHTHGLTTGMLCQVSRIATGVPHLLTVHDVFLDRTFSGAKGRIKRRIINGLLRGIDGVHAVGDDCAENFASHVTTVPAGRVHAISNGVHTKRFADAEAIDVRAALGLSSDTALLGFFGRFMAQKGFRTLVDAVGIMVRDGLERPLAVATFGWGGFIREDFQYVEEQGLTGYFLQQPHTDEPERWIKGLDVIAIPSRWEACPLLPMEVLAAGVPVVGTNCLGLREVLAGSPARVINPGDTGRLAEALRAELANPRGEEFAEYSSAAVDRFAVGESARRIRELYENLDACRR